MKQYPTIDDLIEARAQAHHQANLTCGGVFDADGDRVSHIDGERRVAIKRGTTYTSREYAPHTLGFELSEGAKAARYIRNFGYVELR